MVLIYYSVICLAFILKKRIAELPKYSPLIVGDQFFRSSETSSCISQLASVTDVGGTVIGLDTVMGLDFLTRE